LTVNTEHWLFSVANTEEKKQITRPYQQTGKHERCATSRSIALILPSTFLGNDPCLGQAELAEKAAETRKFEEPCQDPETDCNWRCSASHPAHLR